MRLGGKHVLSSWSMVELTPNSQLNLGYKFVSINTVGDLGVRGVYLGVLEEHFLLLS